MGKCALVLTVLVLVLNTAAGQDFQIRTRVDLVVVPVTVRDGDGSLIADLKQTDFTILEDGVPQAISNFSIDPQPLSAVIIVDTGMGGNSLRRLTPIFSALTGGFSEADEMIAFRYDHLVFQLSEFTNDPVRINDSLTVVNTIAEKAPPTVPPGRPAAAGPKFLSWLLGSLQIGSNGPPGTGEPNTGRPRQIPSSRVLNDALFAAADALESRPDDRRKIILIVSDGQIAGDEKHTQEAVTEKLLRAGIQVYAVRTDYAISDGPLGLLSMYARATGGDAYNGGEAADMERAFFRITEQARYQYVLGYVSSNKKVGPLPVYRTIEVAIPHPGYRVIHRRGYVQ